MKIALCLSGGGLRATLFHLGALRRLNELGVLARVDLVSSVSGGSIINGMLALKWPQLANSNEGDLIFRQYQSEVYEPLTEFCSHDLRTRVVFDWANPANWIGLFSQDRSLTDLLADSYGRQLGFNVELNSLPNMPSFIFCATNLESGVNWEFQSGPTGNMGDYIVGYSSNAGETLARAVAASSSFTPVFPPVIVRRDPKTYVGGKIQNDRQRIARVALTDGGVYDNLGLEPAWNQQHLEYNYVLVSDAGRPSSYVDEPSQLPFGRLKRSFDITMIQINALRKRWMIREFIRGTIRGGYWGLKSDHRNYELPDSQGFTGDTLELLAAIRTDLDRFTPGEQGFLINHGYALADATARKHVAALIAPQALPFNWPEPQYSEPEVAKTELARSDQRGILDDVRDYLLRKVGV